MDTVNEQPVDLKKYCMNPMAPYVKPSGILDIGGCLYLSVEAQNYGDNPYFADSGIFTDGLLSHWTAAKALSRKQRHGIF